MRRLMSKNALHARTHMRCKQINSCCCSYLCPDHHRTAFSSTAFGRTIGPFMLPKASTFTAFGRIVALQPHCFVFVEPLLSQQMQPRRTNACGLQHQDAISLRTWHATHAHGHYANRYDHIHRLFPIVRCTLFIDHKISAVHFIPVRVHQTLSAMRCVFECNWTRANRCDYPTLDMLNKLFTPIIQVIPNQAPCRYDFFFSI